MHVCNGCLGVGLGGVENVRCSSVCAKLSVHWHVQISNLAVGTKDFSQMVLIDIFGEFFDNNLRASHRAWTPAATVAAAFAPVSTISPRTATLGAG